MLPSRKVCQTSQNIDWTTIRQNAGAVRIDKLVSIPVGEYQTLCVIDNVKKNDIIIGRVLFRNSSSAETVVDVTLSASTTFEYQAIHIVAGNSAQTVLSSLATEPQDGKVYLKARVKSDASGKTVSAQYYGIIKIKTSE